ETGAVGGCGDLRGRLQSCDQQQRGDRPGGSGPAPGTGGTAAGDCIDQSSDHASAYLQLSLCNRQDPGGNPGNSPMCVRQPGIGKRAGGSVVRKSLPGRKAADDLVPEHEGSSADG